MNVRTGRQDRASQPQMPRRRRHRRRDWRLAAGTLVAAALVSACLPNFPDPPAIPTGVAASTPAQGGRMVPTTSPIAIRFSDPVAPASVAVSTTPALALGSPQWIGDTTVVFT